MVDPVERPRPGAWITRGVMYSSQALAGGVKRYHTWPTIRQQTVAQHAWRVATIYVEVFGLPRAEVLFYTLHHDSGELWSGDVPFGVKACAPQVGEAIEREEATGRAFQGVELPEITPLERGCVKVCDLLEMWEFGQHEWLFGNRFAEPVIADAGAAALAKASQLPEEAYGRARAWLDAQLDRWPQYVNGTCSCETSA